VRVSGLVCLARRIEEDPDGFECGGKPPDPRRQPAERAGEVSRRVVGCDLGEKLFHRARPAGSPRREVADRRADRVALDHVDGEPIGLPEIGRHRSRAAHAVERGEHLREVGHARELVERHARESRQRRRDEPAERAEKPRTDLLEAVADLALRPSPVKPFELDEHKPVGEIAADRPGVDRRDREHAPEAHDGELAVGVELASCESVAGHGLAERVRNRLGDRRDVVEHRRPASRDGERVVLGVARKRPDRRGALVEGIDQHPGRGRLARALPAREEEDRMRDLGDHRGDDPTDENVEVVVPDVEELSKLPDRAALYGDRKLADELGALEEDRRAVDHAPTGGVDLDRLPVDPPEIDDDRVAVAPVPDRELSRIGLHRLPSKHGERVFEWRGARDAGVLVEVARRERRLHLRAVEPDSDVRAGLVDGERLALRRAPELEAVERERGQLVGGLRAGRRRIGLDRTLCGVDRAANVVGAVGLLDAPLGSHLLGELRFPLGSRRALAEELAREAEVVRGAVGVPPSVRASWRRRLRLVPAEPLVAERVDGGLVGERVAILEACVPGHGEVPPVGVDFD